jgi:hypothetical protein
MPRRNAIWTQYGQTDSETGLEFLVCPDCDGRKFYTLAEFRSHMQRKHGGMVVDGAEPESPEGNAEPVTPIQTEEHPATVEQPKPKRLSGKARELNDKLNEAINLVVKHFIDGLNDFELDRLSLLRGEVSAAVVGVEFDFEQRLFSVSGKIALAITVACLYVLPKLPNFKQMAAKAKEKADKDHATE